jgi:S-adenosylmethionine hydrolase
MSCITLLSDFGLQDASLATAKGILMQHVPGVPVVDISHLSDPFQQMQQAAYLLRVTYRNFPAGTVHLVLFDIFSEEKPRLLLCEKEGYFFLAPDNGILSLALGEEFDRVWKCYELQPPARFRDWLHAAGRTISSLLAEGAVKDLESCEMKVAPQRWQPVVRPDSIECHVVYLDRFGNVVTNLTQDLFEKTRKGRSFRVVFMHDEEIDTLSTYYETTRRDRALCRFNTEGYFEIAFNRGNAGMLLGLKPVREEQVMYNIIKIYFE